MLDKIISYYTPFIVCFYWLALEGRLMLIRDFDLPQGVIYPIAVMTLMPYLIQFLSKNRLAIPKWCIFPLLFIYILVLLNLNSTKELSEVLELILLYIGFISTMFFAKTSNHAEIAIFLRMIIAILSIITILGILRDDGYRGGSLEDPNYLAHILASVAIYSFMRLLSDAKIISKVLLGLIGLAVVIYAIALESRSGLIAILLGLTLIVFIDTYKKKWKSGMIISLAGFSAVLLGAQLPDSFINRFRSSDVLTANGRVDLWLNAWNNIYQNGSLSSILLGFGAGTTENQVDAFTSGATRSVHQNYLLFMQDYGMLGLIILLLIIFAPFKRILLASSRSSQFALACLVLIVIACFTLVISKDLWFWMMTGFAWGISNRERHDSAS